MGRFYRKYKATRKASREKRGVIRFLQFPMILLVRKAVLYGNSVSPYCFPLPTVLLFLYFYFPPLLCYCTDV